MFVSTSRRSPTSRFLALILMWRRGRPFYFVCPRKKVLDIHPPCAEIVNGEGVARKGGPKPFGEPRTITALKRGGELGAKGSGLFAFRKEDRDFLNNDANPVDVPIVRLTDDDG